MKPIIRRACFTCLMGMSIYAQAQSNSELKQELRGLQTQVQLVEQRLRDVDQKADTIHAELKEEAAATEAKVSEVKTALSEIYSRINEDNPGLAIGRIQLRPGLDKVKLTDSTGTVSVDSVKIEVKDGYIMSIRVFCAEDGGKVFMNRQAPIALTERRFNATDKLTCYTKNQKEYIYLYDVVNYFSFKNYIPDNDEFTLIPGGDNAAHLFKRGTGINTIFDLRLYTDALAAFGSQANGLAQTEASFKQVIHRHNIPNTGIFPLGCFKMNLNVSKLDSKVAYVDSSDFSRTALFQRSWLNVEAGINLVNGWLVKRTASTWYVDGGLGLSLSRLGGLSDTTSITSPYFFMSLGTDWNVSDNIGFALSARYLMHSSPQIDIANEDGLRAFMRYSMGMFWNPLGNESGRIFARMIYTYQVDDIALHYLQFQLGYALKLSSLAK